MHLGRNGRAADFRGSVRSHGPSECQRCLRAVAVGAVLVLLALGAYSVADAAPTQKPSSMTLAQGRSSVVTAEAHEAAKTGVEKPSIGACSKHSPATVECHVTGRWLSKGVARSCTWVDQARYVHKAVGWQIWVYVVAGPNCTKASGTRPSTHTMSLRVGEDAVRSYGAKVKALSGAQYATVGPCNQKNGNTRVDCTLDVWFEESGPPQCVLVAQAFYAGSSIDVRVVSDDGCSSNGFDLSPGIRMH